MLWFSVPLVLFEVAVAAAAAWNSLGTGAPRIAITTEPAPNAVEVTELRETYGALGMTVANPDGTLVILLDHSLADDPDLRFRVMVHEFGHVLGLDHADCRAVPSVMCTRAGDLPESSYPTPYDVRMLGARFGYRAVVGGVTR